MRREFFRNISKDIFQEFYRATSLNHNYVLNMTKIDESVLEKFLDFIDKTYNFNSIDHEWILNYVESNFNFWFDIPTRFGKGIVMFSWVFGKKAIERYEKIKKMDTQRFRYGREIRKVVGINIQNKYRVTNKDSKSNTFYKKLAVETSVTEEKVKQKHLNSEEGFVVCVLQTTLYNHKSQFCLQCVYSTECKDTLKKTYEKIYKLRGYE